MNIKTLMGISSYFLSTLPKNLFWDIMLSVGVYDKL